MSGSKRKADGGGNGSAIDDVGPDEVRRSRSVQSACVY